MHISLKPIRNQKSAMEHSRISVSLVFMFLFLSSANLSSSDSKNDMQECAKELAGLSTCIPFVSGKAITPDSTCCSNLRTEMKQSKKCLCFLVEHRNDTNLGFKVNATLALSLPSICHAPVNTSQCPELLQLPANSPAAEVFKEFAANFETNSNNVNSNPTPTSSSSSSIKGSLGAWKIGGFLISALIICNNQ